MTAPSRGDTVIDGVRLPVPPSDRELYDYLGPQRRWVLMLMTVSLVVASISMWRFSTHFLAFSFFLGVVVLNGLGSIVSALSSQNTRQVSAESHHLLTQGWNPAVVPSVDVFLPSAGEDLAILHNTFHHVSQLEWRGELNVYVLDDSGRREVADAAHAHGFVYLSRPDRGWMKKAGNLRYGFQRSQGDLIAIFDADFCPRPDYLLHLVPYFSDEMTAVVQSPQCFDTTRDMGWLERGAGATQELFYRWVQPSRDAREAAICVGTCAVYRRSALQIAGEFVLIEHSEDVYTGVNLYRHGFRLRYVPVKVSSGLCPDGARAFINQQYRWCTGSMSLLRLKHFHQIAVPWRARLGYWSGFLYYITTAVNIFTVHLPGVLMAALYPHDLRLANYIGILPAAWVWLVLLPMTFTGHWRMETLRVQAVYSFTHAVAIFHTLSGRIAPWVATGVAGTGGGGTPGKSHTVQRSVAWLALLYGGGSALLGVGVVGYDMWRYGPTQYYLAMFFALTYAYVMLPVAWKLAPLALRLPRRASTGRRVLRRPVPVRSWTPGPAEPTPEPAMAQLALVAEERS